MKVLRYSLTRCVRCAGSSAAALQVAAILDFEATCAS
jgi:hypothetical protein